MEALSNTRASIVRIPRPQLELAARQLAWKLVPRSARTVRAQALVAERRDCRAIPKLEAGSE